MPMNQNNHIAVFFWYVHNRNSHSCFSHNSDISWRLFCWYHLFIIGFFLSEMHTASTVPYSLMCYLAHWRCFEICTKVWHVEGKIRNSAWHSECVSGVVLDVIESSCLVSPRPTFRLSRLHTNRIFVGIFYECSSSHLVMRCFALIAFWILVELSILHMTLLCWWLRSFFTAFD